MPCRERPHHAIVKETDDIVSQDSDVTGMWVCMKESVFKNLFKNEVSATWRYYLRVNVTHQHFWFCNIRDFVPVNELHRQDFTWRIVTIDFRYVNGHVRRENSCKTLYLCYLDSEVQFLSDGTSKLFY